MTALIGREYGERVSYPISESDIRKWALAVYYPEEPPRLYWDNDYAGKSSFGGFVAPEEFNPFGWMTAQPSGVHRGEAGGTVETTFGVDPPNTKFLLNGGAEVEYTGVRMRPGDVIRSVNALAEYRERAGRLGLMLFTITETRWTNQHGELIKTSRGTLIRY